jgi:DNA-binding Lrp family transcriptional regulator
MFEAMLFLACVTGAMLGAAVYHQRQARKIHKEYEQAKELIQDIIVSFNKQLQGYEERLNLVGYKVELAVSKIDNMSGSMGKFDRLLEKLNKDLREHKEEYNKVRSQLEELYIKIHDVKKSQEKLTKEFSEIKEAEHERAVETGVRTVIPIKREKALAPLNETEVEVLKILAEEGEKSAPQIRIRINLSREHTARLMKKLYEEGYLDRDTHKIPYTYRIKEEMRSLLKKVES